MTGIFEHRCALINKNAVCHPCSELNGLYNSKQDQQEDLIKLELVKNRAKKDPEALFILEPNWRRVFMVPKLRTCMISL